MITLITILTIIACILLVLIVLIQNPKGGGLSSGFGGLNNQVLGVKRTTDFLEKGTWGLAGVLLVLSLGSNFFIPRNAKATNDKDTYKSEVMDKMPNGAKTQAAPAPQAPPAAAPAPAPAPNTKK